MATDECDEVGRGPCPCGKGVITVERCVPDHPWAKPHQVSFTPALVCAECEPNYTFSEPDWRSHKPRLVMRHEVEQREQARQTRYDKLWKIESSDTFKDLAQRLETRLALEKSAAARHRVLCAAGLRPEGLEKYRKSGFRLSASGVAAALALLKVEAPELAELAKEAEELADEAYRPIQGVKTGINGLEI
jgi:hypothetical protein